MDLLEEHSLLSVMHLYANLSARPHDSVNNSPPSPDVHYISIIYGEGDHTESLSSLYQKRRRQEKSECEYYVILFKTFGSKAYIWKVGKAIWELI